MEQQNEIQEFEVTFKVSVHRPPWMTDAELREEVRGRTIIMVTEAVAITREAHFDPHSVRVTQVGQAPVDKRPGASTYPAFQEEPVVVATAQKTPWWRRF